MNTSYAVIENGMVVNVIVWDGEAELTVLDNQQLIDISDISLNKTHVGEVPSECWAYLRIKFVGYGRSKPSLMEAKV